MQADQHLKFIRGRTSKRHVMLLLALGIMLSFAFAYPPSASSDVASWMQALGAVLAIYAAVEISASQAEQVELARQIAAADAAGQGRAVVEATCKIIESTVQLLKAVGTGQTLGMSPERLTGTLPLLDSAVALPMPQPTSAAIVEMRTLLIDLAEMIRSQQGGLIFGHSRVQDQLDVALAVSAKCRAQAAAAHADIANNIYVATFK